MLYFTITVFLTTLPAFAGRSLQIGMITHLICVRFFDRFSTASCSLHGVQNL